MNNFSRMRTKMFVSWSCLLDSQYSTFKADINNVYSDSQSQFLCNVLKALTNSTKDRKIQESFRRTLLKKNNKKVKKPKSSSWLDECISTLQNTSHKEASLFSHPSLIRCIHLFLVKEWIKKFKAPCPCQMWVMKFWYLG